MIVEAPPGFSIHFRKNIFQNAVIVGDGFMAVVMLVPVLVTMVMVGGMGIFWSFQIMAAAMVMVFIAMGMSMPMPMPMRGGVMVPMFTMFMRVIVVMMFHVTLLNVIL